MSKVLINDTTMTDIADAIREKDGSTAQMYPSEMAGKIQSIETKPETTKITIKISNNYYGWTSDIIYGNNKKQIANTGSITIDAEVGQIVAIGYHSSSYNTRMATNYKYVSKTGDNIETLTKESGIIFRPFSKNANGSTYTFQIVRS